MGSEKPEEPFVPALIKFQQQGTFLGVQWLRTRFPLSFLPPFPRIFCARGVGDGGYMFTSLQGNLSEGRNWALNGFGSP